MAKILIPIICALLAPMSVEKASARTLSEAELVRAAEEIAVSGLDDEEKIERLTQIRERVIELRKKPPPAEPPPRPTAEKPAESARPISTYLQNEALGAIRPETRTTEEERPPGFLARAGFFLGRALGWIVVLGFGACVFLGAYLSLVDFCERSKNPNLVLFAFRQRMKLRKLEADRPPEIQNPAGVARDGMVPQRLR